MTRYLHLKSSISLEDFEDLLAFSVAEFEFDKNQNKPCLALGLRREKHPKNNKIFSCFIRNSMELLRKFFGLLEKQI